MFNNLGIVVPSSLAEIALNIDSTSFSQEKLSSYSTLGGVKCEWECQLENTARIARSISRCDVAVLQVCESDSLFTSSTLAFELAVDSLVDLTSSLVESQGNAMEVFQLRKKRNVKEHPCISGSPFFNYFAYIPILDGTGSRLGRLCLLGTKDNILEQDQWDGLDGVKEQVLFILESKRQQVQFRVSQKVARIGNWSLDVQGERIYWSDELFRIFGLDPAEGEPAFEEHIAKHIHPDDRELWLDKVTKAVKLGESYEMEFRGTQPSGKVVWLKAFGQAFRDEDGKIVSLSGTAQDITHSKLLEIKNDKMRRESRKLLEEHKRFLINTLNNIPAVFYAKDRDGRLISINTAFEKLYKLKEQEVIGKTDHELFGAEVADAFRKNDLVVINKKDVIEAEEGAVGGDGKLRLYHSYRFPYYDEHGEVIATGGISIDVTEKKELERQAFLNSKLASIGELAAGVGHEINNPLAIIKGYVETIQYSITDDEHFDNKTLLEYLDKVNTATDRIANIVQGLRRFARSDSDVFEDVILSEAISGPVDMVRDIYRNDGVSISFNEKPIEGVQIYGSLGRLQQVFMNLLSNARDATAGQDERRIEIGTSVSNGKACVVVEDNGTGIPEVIIDKIFDPFFSTKEVTKGSGIGLSIVHNMVEEHHGEIRCESREGQGTKFYLEFPISKIDKSTDSQVKKNKLKTSSEKTNLQKIDYRVILADDEEAIRDILKKALEDFGLKVQTVENGEQAFDLYTKSESFDLIISDMKMPVMDGITLLKKVRFSKKIKKQPKVIMITGGININFEDKDTEYGQLIDGYLLKPFDNEQIYKVIKDVMNPNQDQTSKSTSGT